MEGEEKHIPTTAFEDNDALVAPTGPFIIDFILEDTPEKTQRDALEETLGVFPIPTGNQDLLDFTFEDSPEQTLQTEKDTIEKTPAFISSLECWNWSVEVEIQKKIPEETEHETKGLYVVLFCWFGIALKAAEAVAARFANPKLE